jgi:hypothetical protein
VPSSESPSAKIISSPLASPSWARIDPMHFSIAAASFLQGTITVTTSSLLASPSSAFLRGLINTHTQFLQPAIEYEESEQNLTHLTGMPD